MVTNKLLGSQGIMNAPQSDLWAIVGELGKQVPGPVHDFQLVLKTLGIFGSSEIDQFYGRCGTFVSGFPGSLGRWPLPDGMFLNPWSTKVTMQALFEVGEFRDALRSEAMQAVLEGAGQFVIVSLLHGVVLAVRAPPALIDEARGLEMHVIGLRGGRRFVQEMMGAVDDSAFQCLLSIDIDLEQMCSVYGHDAPARATLVVALQRLVNGRAPTKDSIARALVRMALFHRRTSEGAVIIKATAAKLDYDPNSVATFIGSALGDAAEDFFELAINATDLQTSVCYGVVREIITGTIDGWPTPTNYVGAYEVETVDTCDLDFSRACDPEDWAGLRFEDESDCE
jgi:hypothetical protein